MYKYLLSTLQYSTLQFALSCAYIYKVQLITHTILRIYMYWYYCTVLILLYAYGAYLVSTNQNWDCFM